MIEPKKFKLQHTPTETMWANFLIKPLPRDNHKECCTQLSLTRVVHDVIGRENIYKSVDDVIRIDNICNAMVCLLKLKIV